MLTVFIVITLAGHFSRFQSSISPGLVSIITIFTKGSSVATNLIGSIYIISSFFLMKILQGVSPLASAPHIIWYRNFEGVQNNENVYFMIANVVLVFVLYLMITLNILKRQDL